MFTPSVASLPRPPFFVVGCAVCACACACACTWVVLLAWPSKPSTLYISTCTSQSRTSSIKSARQTAATSCTQITINTPLVRVDSPGSTPKRLRFHNQYNMAASNNAVTINSTIDISQKHHTSMFTTQQNILFKNKKRYLYTSSRLHRMNGSDRDATSQYIKSTNQTTQHNGKYILQSTTAQHQ